MSTAQFYTKKEELTENYGKFVLEPLMQSFGNSLGTVFRRTLLSSLKGSAVTAVKIEGASHIFSTVKGVKESVLELVLNLKQLRFEIPEDGKFKISLTKKGAGKVYGNDIEGEVKVINKDLYIGELTDDKAKLQIEAYVETGLGYIPAEEQATNEFGYIPVDSAFSPVKKVNYKVVETRVGRKTNFDKLILEIWTDGSITPEQALKQSSVILSDHFNHVLAQDEEASKKEMEEAKEQQLKEQIDKKFSDLIIDELNLPSRVVNALLRENIETVADLIKIGKDKLIGLKGLGKKSIDLIEEELKKLGVSLQ